jgi:hypothetical protein
MEVHRLTAESEEQAEEAIKRQQQMSKHDDWLDSNEARDQEKQHYINQLHPGLKVLVKHDVLTLEEAQQIQEEYLNGTS